jgi:hypothetical protein
MMCSIKVHSPAGLRGVDLLDTPIWNKGTAFDEAERAAFGLRGLLPPHIESLEQQSIRAYEGFKAKTTDLERHMYVRQLQDNNEILFYRLLLASVQVSQSPGIRSPTSHLFLFSRDRRRLLAELIASVQIEVLPWDGGKGGPYGKQSKERRVVSLSRQARLKFWIELFQGVTQKPLYGYAWLHRTELRRIRHAG